MKTRHIHISGIVQGVGFRPRVYVLARELGLNGWVNNTPDGVHIEIQGIKEKISLFEKTLRSAPPELAHITDWRAYDIDKEAYKRFYISESDEAYDNTVLLTPDYALCHECESELFDPADRRYRYPFITCTCCGPRFSIINKLPYDRERTTMHEFRMCAECNDEYNDVADRRYYSQTNSCQDCGVEMTYHRDGDQISGNNAILERIQKDLIAGDILAVKGIGGYLLMCDATQPESVRLLRRRKGRPSKPFALLYPTEELLLQDVRVSDQEMQAYNSVEAPIVLFHPKKKSFSQLSMEDIAPNLDRLGIMRPYAPLLSIISRDFGKPLIATSGNLSGSPIVFEDEKAIKSLSWVADAVISHNRVINIPEDDSVVKFTDSRKILIRRSRGLAPNYFGRGIPSNKPFLAMGASLKSTFAIQHGKNTYISQYLGDQDSFDTQESYSKTLSHVSGVLDFQPDHILVDMHPQYSSTILGRKIAREEELLIDRIQHHEAHFAAVLGENNQLESEDPVLGVIWDGTGYGHDHQVWGGEFFRYFNSCMDRIEHFEYYDHILGNKMPREPRLSALTLLHNTIEESELRPFFKEDEWSYYHKILRQGSSIKTSSAGRLFDAAACVLGLGDRVSYEGEAAAALESLAVKAARKERRFINPDMCLSPSYHLLRMLRMTRQGYSKADAAWQFHAGLADTIMIVANRYGFKKLAFSGGVFQNGVLVDLICERSDPSWDLYFHNELSPNDENISFGQLVHAMEGIKSSEVSAKQSLVY